MTNTNGHAQKQPDPALPKAEAFDFIQLQGGPNGLYIRFGQNAHEENEPTHVVSVTCTPRVAELLAGMLGKWVESYRARWGPIPHPESGIVTPNR